MDISKNTYQHLQHLQYHQVSVLLQTAPLPISTMSALSEHRNALREHRQVRADLENALVRMADLAPTLELVDHIIDDVFKPHQRALREMKGRTVVMSDIDSGNDVPHVTDPESKVPMSQILPETLLLPVTLNRPKNHVAIYGSLCKTLRGERHPQRRTTRRRRFTRIYCQTWGKTVHLLPDKS